MRSLLISEQLVTMQQARHQLLLAFHLVQARSLRITWFIVIFSCLFQNFVIPPSSRYMPKEHLKLMRRPHSCGSQLSLKWHSFWRCHKCVCKILLVVPSWQVGCFAGSTVKSVVELLSESVSGMSVKDEVVSYLTPTVSTLLTSQFSNYHGDKCRIFYLMKLISMWLRMLLKVHIHRWSF